MTIKEYLQGKTLTSVGVCEGIILHLVFQTSIKSIEVDTSNIMQGTPVVRREDFTLVGDILSIDNITIDISKTNVRMPLNTTLI